MNPTLHRLLSIATLGATLVLSGCASDKAPSNTTFDFGPALMPATPTGSAIGAVVVTDVTGSAALDSERMYYRLNYSDPLQARSYSQSRWSATPLQLITQRLKTRIAQSGAKALNATDAAAGVPILRVEVDDFTHSFSSVNQSEGQVVIRASLFTEHKLIDQKTFVRNTSASSANAAGGAQALAASTDAIAADMVAWLSALRARK
ncbi:MAG: ABC-type transport auxiliary lipoprotein family protein [Pseudomonadota bacterium]